MTSTLLSPNQLQIRRPLDRPNRCLIFVDRRRFGLESMISRRRVDPALHRQLAARPGL